MIWPSNLVAVTLMNAMYEQNDKKDPSIIGLWYDGFTNLWIKRYGYDLPVREEPSGTVPPPPEEIGLTKIPGMDDPKLSEEEQKRLIKYWRDARQVRLSPYVPRKVSR